MRIALAARAKLNLDLEVLGRDTDGYHDIRTTFQSIELHDLIDVSPGERFTLTTSGLPFDTTRSSIRRAQEALEQAAGRRLPVEVHVEKRIPPGSGMGGASSDAAVTLRALRDMFRLDGVNLPEVATSIGADVAYFLTGGRAHAEGRGERLTRLPFEPAWFAIAWPGIELSTAAVYRAWDEVGGDGSNHLRRAAERVEPRIAEFAGTLGHGWQMTGSGSAFFKRTATEDEGRKTIAELGCWTAVTRALPAWG